MQSSLGQQLAHITSISWMLHILSSASRNKTKRKCFVVLDNK